ncbi:cell differentiation protein rcd1-like [Gossypium australe]|uniref:Cell differentiation protein rcd1-like n=1 Tax=Gossypium australe TaxID=47621 RepID=A0A5B6UQA9_9ROSI|nr:cell differentiation protein rcd1-like [Gossypium australe]
MVRKAAYPPSFRPIRNPCINLLQIYRLVQQLRSLEIGEQCLDLLSKNRHSCNLLAIFLWSSSGSMRLLLLVGPAISFYVTPLSCSIQYLDPGMEVITSAYRPLVSNRLSERVVRRTCNAIGLFQYLYAFLKTRSRERNYERLRLTIQKSLITFLPQKCFLVAYAAWKLAQHCQKQWVTGFL